MSEEFKQGADDCSEGLPHKDGKGAEYDCGYNEQYAYEQELTEKLKERLA